MTKVSVVLPCYNHAAFLPARLDSIFNQTYPEYEVLLLDDCSTDGSVELLKKYEHHPKLAALLVNDRNSGPFGQWQRAIRLARGEYIWIAESDDVAEPSFLAQLTRALDENPSVGVAYCQSRVIDEKGATLFDNRCWTDDLDPELWRSSFQIQGLEALRRFFVFKNVIPNVSAALFRKAVFEQVSGDFMNFKYAGDWLVWGQMLQVSDLFFWPELLNQFRVHDRTTRVRTRPDQSARYLTELYTVVGRVAEHAELDATSAAHVYDRLARRVWTELGWKNLAKPDSLRLISRLSSFDRQLSSRLLGHAGRAVLRRMRAP